MSNYLPHSVVDFNLQQNVVNIQDLKATYRAYIDHYITMTIKVRQILVDNAEILYNTRCKEKTQILEAIIIQNNIIFTYLSSLVTAF